jgi:predicted nucleic acid-binding protein
VTVLFDTSALLALASADDLNHDRAIAGLADVRGERRIVHSYVIVEATALIQNRLGMAGVRKLHDELLPGFDIHWIDPETHATAVTALLAADTRRVSFVDRVSFEVMRRDGISTAFAFDGDFARQGFRTIPA